MFSGKSNFGTNNAESLSNLLLSLTACLIAFLEVTARTACPPIHQDDTGDRAEGESVKEEHGSLRAPLSLLRVHLLFIKDRQVGCSLILHTYEPRILCTSLTFNIKRDLVTNHCTALFLRIVIVIVTVIVIVMQAIFEDDCAQVSSEKELLEGIEHFLCGIFESLEG